MAASIAGSATRRSNKRRLAEPAARVIDVPALVLAEHAENEIRKDFTPSERVAIGKAVEEELGRVERRGRPKTENPDQGNLIESEIGENLPQFEFPESGQKTREVAAKKAGSATRRSNKRRLAEPAARTAKRNPGP